MWNPIRWVIRLFQRNRGTIEQLEHWTKLATAILTEILRRLPSNSPQAKPAALLDLLEANVRTQLKLTPLQARAVALGALERLRLAAPADIVKATRGDRADKKG